MSKKDDVIGWITVKGVHVPLHAGQSTEDAIKESIDYRNKQLADNQSTADKMNQQEQDNDIQKEIYKATGNNAPVYRTEDSKRFADCIKFAKEHNKNGGSVDEHSIEEYDKMQKFLSPNGDYGVAVEPDGNITSVFKADTSQAKGVLKNLILTARAHGGTKMDCYGRWLTRAYENCGYTTVAKVNFNSQYATDAKLLAEKPDVYVLMKSNENMVRVFSKIHNGGYHQSTDERLDGLKTFDENSYDSAIMFRDSIIKNQGKEK